MLEYKLEEATDLLRTNESNARTTLKSLEEDFCGFNTRADGKGRMTFHSWDPGMLYIP